MNKLYILCGVPFSGKSVLAKSISEKLGYVRVDLDEIKFALYGSDVKDGNLKQPDWDIIHQSMYKKIEKLLMEGKTVVHDTGNFTKHERNIVRQIANKLELESITIFVDTPKSIAHQRLLDNRKTKNRFDVSDGDFESTSNEMEPPGSEENVLTFHHDDLINAWISKNL